MALDTKGLTVPKRPKTMAELGEYHIELPHRTLQVSPRRDREDVKWVAAVRDMPRSQETIDKLRVVPQEFDVLNRRFVVALTETCNGHSLLMSEMRAEAKTLIRTNGFMTARMILYFIYRFLATDPEILEYLDQHHLTTIRLHDYPGKFREW